MVAPANSKVPPMELATVSAEEALPGLPPTSKVSPPLPEEITTTLPSSVSALTNAFSGSSAALRSEPTERFTTVVCSATSFVGSASQSRAALTYAVEPAQPKTFRATRSASGAEPGPTCMSSRSSEVRVE